jgi:1,4-dihydroxy-2-naphthoate octaprenyltransferase
MGFSRGKQYQLLLITLGWISFLSYLYLIKAPPFAYLILLSLPFFIKSLLVIVKTNEERSLDPELKKLALSITFFTLLFGLGLLIG